MAWSSPPVWTVGQLVTAAQVTVLSDDLTYLKGTSAPVQIDNDITAVLAGGASLTSQGTNNGSFARFRLLTKRTSAVVVDWRIIANGISDAGELVFYDTTAGAERLRIDNTGKVGIGTAAPTGMIHAVGVQSGVVHWEHASVDGTARTVLPAPSVGFVATVVYAIRDSNGTTYGGTVNGMTTTAFPVNDGTNILKLDITGGALTIQRTGGTRTYRVVLWVVYT